MNVRDKIISAVEVEAFQRDGAVFLPGLFFDDYCKTPLHQHAPYYFVDGKHTVSFWVPVDPVRESTLRIIVGSHKWEKLVLPTRWLSNEDFYPGSDDFLPVPDSDMEPEKFDVLEWPMEPGDAVAFHYRTVHGARGNLSTRVLNACGRRRCPLRQSRRAHLPAFSGPRHD